MMNLTIDSDIAVLQMDRPPVNAMNSEFLLGLETAWQQACDAGARGVVISGREGLFSAGLDVPALLELSAEGVFGFWQVFFRVVGRLGGSPVPVVAAITGHAPAGGAVLALHCDYRVATRGEYRIGLNEVQVGLPVPAGILQVLQSVVGERQAARLAMTGALVTPEEALCLGLVDELTDEGGAVQAAQTWLSTLLELPPVAMNTTRLAAKATLTAQAQFADQCAREATDYWLSEETQRTMQALAASLGK